MHRLGVDYQAVRTHFFDECFGDAAGAGLRSFWPPAAGSGFRPEPADRLACRGPAALPARRGQDRLFEMVTALSAPGSQIAVEVFRLNSSGNTQRWLRLRERLGLDVNVQLPTDHEPDRSDAVEWLAGKAGRWKR